jgi:pimeloyl-ACP methyl ester carboxylesterase
VVGTSFGGSIALGLVTRRPDLVRRVVVHEPPLLSVMSGDDAFAQAHGPAFRTIDTVRAMVTGGDAEGAARTFVEQVALGPGAWNAMPAPLRWTMIDGAASFVAEQDDAGWATIDPDALASTSRPVLVSSSDDSPAWFGPVASRLGELVRGARTHTYEGGNHTPHVLRPQAYVETVSAFLQRAFAVNDPLPRQL